MILNKPHRITINQVDQGHDDRGVQTGVIYRNLKTIDCQVTPERTKTVQDKYGIDTKRPQLVMCDCADIRDDNGEELIEAGTRVLFNGKPYSVLTPPEVWEGIGDADHCSFIVDEASYSNPETVNHAG